MDDDKQERVATWLSVGQATWPGIKIVGGDIRSLLEEHAGRGEPVHEPADLYLAAAASLGDVAAVAEVDRLLRQAAMVRTVAGVLAPAALEEVVQEVRARLLVGAGPGPSPLRTYSGRGPLAAWLRVVLLRSVFRAWRSAQSGLEVEELWVGLPAASADPALQLIRRQAAPIFRAAFEHAFAALSDRERTVLRQHFVDGLGAPQIAVVYQIHRVTAFRRIAQAKARLLEILRAELCRELGAGPEELDSFMGIVRGAFSFTLERLLADRP